ncbi:Hypothetical predicted protein, partial [Pelobates cultripes]
MATQQQTTAMDTNTKPATWPLEAFDQHCKSFWMILCNQGLTRRQAVKAVAPWIRPVTRRSYYGPLPRIPKTTAQQCRYQRPTRREGEPHGTGADTRSHNHRRWSVRLAQETCTSHDTRTWDWHGIPPHSTAPATNSGIIWRSTPQFS